MSRSLLALLAMGMSTFALAQDLQGPKLTPESFSVVKPSAEKAAGFGTPNTGTRVAVRLDLVGQKLISIDREKSKVDSFTDDKNTDLLKAAAAGGRPAKGTIGLERAFTNRSPNTVTFLAPGVPTRGATGVRIKGTLIAVVGKEEKEFKKKEVSLKDGIDLEFGTIKLLKSNFGGRDERGTRATYEGSRPIISIALLDSDGKEIASRSVETLGPPPAAGLGRPRYRTTLMVTGEAVDNCEIRVKYYNSTEEVKVPVDLQVGPGL